MAKQLSELSWIESLLPKSYARKAMFGGFAYYLDELLVLVMFESTGSRSYKNKKYDFEIWNGCMFPAERDQHALLIKDYPFLLNHPILPKWLYLPLETEAFDDHVELLLKAIRARDSRLGTIPKRKTKSLKKASEKSVKKSTKEKIDMRRPHMFSDKKEKRKTRAKISSR